MRICSHLVFSSIQVHVTKPRLDEGNSLVPFHALGVSAMILLVYTGKLTKMIVGGGGGGVWFDGSRLDAWVFDWILG